MDAVHLEQDGGVRVEEAQRAPLEQEVAAVDARRRLRVDRRQQEVERLQVLLEVGMTCKSREDYCAVTSGLTEHGVERWLADGLQLRLQLVNVLALGRRERPFQKLQ